MNPVTYDILTQRVKNVGNLPSMPAVLRQLNEVLSEPANKIQFDAIVETISYDESLAAQCLRLANSALFRHRGEIANIHDAVQSLGLWRVRDLAFSCGLPMVFGNLSNGMGKEIFWRHALGTAVVSEKLAVALGATRYHDAYLSGLLHDIGVLVNGVLFSEDFRDVLEEAMAKKISLEAVETRVLGFTHSESGRILAELWRLPLPISDTIEYHYHPVDQKSPNEVSCIVQASDRICQKYGLGYGYEIAGAEVDSLEVIWDVLCVRFPRARAKEEFVKQMEKHVVEATGLADHFFASAMAV